MKTLIVVAVIALAGCSSPTAPQSQVQLPKHPVVHPSNDLECGSCTDALGRSGYTVNLGRCEAC